MIITFIKLHITFLYLYYNLDGDDIPVTNTVTGETIVRDNVQFVNFSELGNDGEKLAVKVLEAVPRQLEEFGRKKGL